MFGLALRLQDIFKTSCQDVFKTSSKRLQDVLKTSSRHFQDAMQRYLQDVFKTYYQTALVNTSWRSIQDVSETFFSKDGYPQRDLPR